MFQLFFHPLRQALINYTPPFSTKPFLKSLQHISPVIPVGEVEVNTTITAVDFDNTFLVMGNFACGALSPAQSLCLCLLTSSTNVILKRFAFHVSLYVESEIDVVEVNPDYIKSIQPVNDTVPDGTTFADFTITEVDLSKTFVLYCGCCPAADTPSASWALRFFLLNSTTLRADRQAFATDVSFNVYIVELK